MKAAAAGFRIRDRFEKIERQQSRKGGISGGSAGSRADDDGEWNVELHDEESLSGCRHILKRIKKDIRNMSFSENADPVKRTVVAGEIYTSASNCCEQRSREIPGV